jgi:uncharacterized protein
LVPPVPTPASFISDARGVLTTDQRRSLDARITAFQQAGLGDIAVAILPSIGSYTPNQVAVEIYRTWKVGSVAPVGSAHRNVGVLLLIVPRELAPDGKGQCWVNTGTGSEGIITDAMAGRICRDSVIPHLREKDYVGAVAAGISAIEDRMRRDSAIVSEPFRPAAAPISETIEDDDGVPKAPIAIGGLIALVIAAITGRRYARNRPRKCPKCAQRMQRLGEIADNAMLEHGALTEEKLGSVDYDVWVCDCGGKRILPYKRLFTKYKECRKCRRITASGKRVVIESATTASAGKAEERYRCKACDATWVEYVVIPQIVEAAASSGSGSSFSRGGGGGGGGGGSSFGGSGSTAGGGGGSSY